MRNSIRRMWIRLKIEDKNMHKRYITVPANLEMVAQARDRETDHGQSPDGPNHENAHNNNTIRSVCKNFTLLDRNFSPRGSVRVQE